MPKPRKDWRTMTLVHFREHPETWLSAYELARQLTHTNDGTKSGGRSAWRIGQECKVMAAEGILETREIAQEGAPYGRLTVYYRLNSQRTLASRRPSAG